MSKNLEPGATSSPTSSLPDENGDVHRLSELQGDDALVLMLGRGEHCPRERQHQREMVEFHAVGARWRSRRWSPCCPTTCTTSSR